MAKGKSICVYGAKGGIGKTTFILNLAGTLSNLNKRVLIIDLDLSNGAIACSLNANLTKTIYNFCDDYNNNRFDDIEDYFIKYNENISFIAATKDPRQANKIDTKYIDILIDKCNYLFDVILVDTTNSLDQINVFAFDKCDYVYFMTSNDPISLKNLKNILNIFDDNYRNYYEIFVGSFYDSDGDGMGDLKGVEEKLDYISDLGCNGIWLMPIMPSPTYHKYDTTDYEAVDEAYGTAPLSSGTTQILVGPENVAKELKDSSVVITKFDIVLRRTYSIAFNLIIC